jgi:hypothetical protein
VNSPTPLRSVMPDDPAAVVARMLDVFFPDAETILDVTFGSGRFWPGPVPKYMTGLDLDPARAPHVVGDFRALPFADGSFDLVIFDPPHLSYTGKRSRMGARFGGWKNHAEMRAGIAAGCREAWRVARLGVIVKVTDHVQASRFIYQSGIVLRALGEDLIYGQVITYTDAKMTRAEWTKNGPPLSAYSNGAVHWAFRKDGPIHKRRRAAEGRAA